MDINVPALIYLAISNTAPPESDDINSSFEVFVLDWREFIVGC